MGMYSNGTFRVRSKKFSFTGKGNNVTYFPNSKAMWDGLGVWNKFSNHFSQTIGGSEADAAIIEQGLAFLDMPRKYQQDLLTEYEQQMLNEILRETGGDSTFLGFSSKLSSQLRGERFEQRLAKMLDKLTTSGSEANINVGKHQTRSGAEERIIIDTSNFKTPASNKAAIWEAIKQQIGIDYQEFVDNAVVEIENGFKTSATSVVIRSGTRFGKVDIDGSQCGTVVKSELNGIVRAMAERMIGHTFSLKNYQATTMSTAGYGWGGISLGYANDFRAYSSFYIGATGDNNFANICTFIYASLASRNKIVKRYISWARFIYELTGFGLEDITSPGSKTLVDYLIINTANARSYGKVRVLWVGSLFDGMPDAKDPPYHQVDVTNWGKTTQKWIFSSSNFSFSNANMWQS